MFGVVERLDEVGRPAWIAAMIAGFVLFFPLGLAILAFLIWSGRMGCRNSSFFGEDRQDRWQRRMDRMQDRMSQWQDMRNRAFGGAAFSPSGNRAFDQYRHETIKRLEDEANEFRSFLDRLRHARDKAEFDQFMADRKLNPHNDDNSGETGDRQPPAR